MNNGSRRCSTSGCAASGAWSSTWIRAALAGASRRWRPLDAGGRPSTGGSSVAPTTWSLRRRGGLPQVNPGTILVLAVAAISAAWAAGLIRPHYEDGRLTLRALRAGRVFATFDFRVTGLLLLLALTMGWAVAAAVERSQWVPGTEGRLVPAVAITTLLGWLLVSAGLSRLACLLASMPVTLGSLLLLTPSPLLSANASVAALIKWVQALPHQTNPLLLIAFLLMFALTGSWASWWIFRQRNGLVALLPTGTILAVEIINDIIPGPVFFTVVWLAAAASVLLRLNFVEIGRASCRERV